MIKKRKIFSIFRKIKFIYYLFFSTVNYGEIGFIIGHEVSHGFDATGMK